MITSQFMLLVLILMMLQIVTVSIAQGLTEDSQTQRKRGILHGSLLAGQSNMQGQGVVDLDHPQHYNGGKGTLKKLMEQDSTRPIVSHLVDPDGAMESEKRCMVQIKN